MKISESIIDNILKYSFTAFLKNLKLSSSGNKAEIIERIENSLSTEPIKKAFSDFLIKELKYGKNKQLFYCHLDIKNQTLLKNKHHVQQQLALHNIPRESFNNLLKEDPINDEILFLKLDRSEENKSNIGIIEFCIYKEIETNNSNTNLLSNYVWIELNLDENFMLIRVRPQQNMINFYTTRSLCEEITDRIQSLFDVSFKVNMLATKETLYKMYKEFILKAELPYHETIEAISNEIEESQKEILLKLNIVEDSAIAKNILFRYKKLLERILILEDFDTYSTETEERSAIVERLSMSDRTGASANILPGDEDGLEVATIYNDVRDTIDEIMMLNKVWIKWFYTQPDLSKQLTMFDNEPINISQYKTRIEVFDKYLILTFLKDQYIEKEVQDFVFDSFRKFEEIPISTSGYPNASMVAGNT